MLLVNVFHRIGLHTTDALSGAQLLFNRELCLRYTFLQICDIFASRTFSPTEFLKLLPLMYDKVSCVSIRHCCIEIITLSNNKSFFHYTFSKISDLGATDDQ